MMQSFQQSRFGALAIELLEQAIGEVRDGHDALPTIACAEAVLRAEAGEIPADVLDEVEWVLN